MIFSFLQKISHCSTGVSPRNLTWHACSAQVVVIIILPSVDGPVSLAAKNLLEIVIFSQYIPRFVRIYPLFKEITRTSGILTETAWVGAVFNLFLYMLASHVSWI